MYQDAFTMYQDASTMYQDAISRWLHNVSRRMQNVSRRFCILSRRVQNVSRHLCHAYLLTVMSVWYNFSTQNVHVLVRFQYRMLVVDYNQKIYIVLLCLVRDVSRPDTSATYVRNPSRLQEYK